MSTLIISRSGQIRLPLHDRKRDFPARVLTQAQKACGNFFGRVDIDRLRNMAKKISNKITISLRAPTPEMVAVRKQILQKYPKEEIRREIVLNRQARFRYFMHCIKYLLYIDRQSTMTKPERIDISFPRERLLSKLLFVAMTLVTVSTVSQAFAPTTTQAVVNNIETAASTVPGMAKLVGPINWTTGDASLKGSKASVIGAYNYAKTARYAFAANEAERDALIANGTFVKIDSKYVRFHNASSPYVLPVVARFVDRLAQQYVAAGCGPLVVNGGMRPLDFQGTLKNGSDQSVHPTGMSVDLFRDTDESSFCYQWLEKRLISIEANRRIDATAENYNRHFHVTVVPHTYEAWLQKLPKGLDPEVKFLALALYFETAGNETREGWRAVGWVVRNRVRSGQFPNTYVGVVAEGAAGRSAGGCQFSFMCDGKAEKIQTLCEQSDALMAKNWLNRCDEKWATAVEFAKQIMAEPESADPTGGAVLYYAASMDKPPYWARPRAEERADGSTMTLPHGDFKYAPRQIGSHIFGCRRNSDACRS